MTPDPQTERFLRPLPVANAIETAAPERIAVVGGPVPRERVDAPIAPGPTPLDTQLFQDPKESGKFYWLPRYHLGEEKVSGQNRYRIGFSAKDEVWRLTIRLDTRPAPGMDAAAAQHAILEHELDVLLTYTALGATTSRKTLRFQEVLRDETGAEATLIFTGLPQRDEVFGVLEDPSRAPDLIVQRKVRVAIKQAQETSRLEAGTLVRPAITAIRDPRIITAIRPTIPLRPIVRPPATSLPTPQLKYLGVRRVAVRGVKFDRHELGIVNWNGFSDSLFAPSPNLPPCGQNTKAARTWLDILDGGSGKRLYGYCAFSKNENLQKFTVAVKVGARPPQSFKVRLTDRQTKKTVTSNAVPLQAPPPPPPQYVTVSADMAQSVEPKPFAFSRELHGYIFTGLAQGPTEPDGGATGGLLRHKETHLGGPPHSYFQDAAERTLFFYLPDEFRIARRGGDFRPPFMTLRVRSNGGSTSNTDVTWDYAVTPWTNPARLATAREKLASASGHTAEEIEFQPLVTSAVTFTIQRPTEAGRVTEERPSSSLMLEGAVVDTLAIPVVDFQLAFDAMLGRTASVLSGSVAIEVEGWEIERRPFIADFAALAGPVTSLASSIDDATGQLSIDIVDAVESPIALDSLKLAASRGGVAVEIDLSGVIPPGATLGPGEMLTISVPSPALPGAGEIEVFATTDATSRPDDAAILDAILDRATLEYYRDVTVRAIPALFLAPAGRPEDQVIAILVEFEGGDTVELSADIGEAAARVDYPFDDVITRHAAHDGTYRYRRTIIRVDGRQDRDAEPLSATSSILFLSTFP